MTKLWFSALVVLGVLLSACPLYANGEPTGEMSGSGIIVPIDGDSAYVRDQKITVTMPTVKGIFDLKPTDNYAQPAIIRVEYTIENVKHKPLQIMVGWPTSGYQYTAEIHSKLDPAYAPAIKLDGKPVGATLLTYADLADQYVKPWLAQIDKLLDSKPELKNQVEATCRDAVENAKMLFDNAENREKDKDLARYEREWLEDAGAGRLGLWLTKNKIIPREGPFEGEFLAGGLLGVIPSATGNSLEELVQNALKWLDPTYEPIDVYEILSERWGHEPVLLDPDTNQLMDMMGALLGWEPSFGVFRFPITLQPEKTHKLIVQYAQSLGGIYRGPGKWFGLMYIMEPAKRWAGWRKTTIEVRVPSEWAKVAIRPPTNKVGTSGGMDIYRVTIQGRPCENLFISVVPPAKIRDGNIPPDGGI